MLRGMTTMAKIDFTLKMPIITNMAVDHTVNEQVFSSLVHLILDTNLVISYIDKEKTGCRL